MRNYSISIIVAVYNEQDNVEPLTREIETAMGDHPRYEIIYVDDGSTDHTVAKLRALQTSIPQLRVVEHQNNFGQSAAIVTGAFAARNDWLVMLDGDGQNDPADIPKLLAALQQQQTGKPILINGLRLNRQDTWLRKLSSRIANGIRRSILKDDCPDTGCSLKCISRQVFVRLPHFNHVHRFIPALVKRAGGKIIMIPVHHRPRLRGQAKYGVGNRLWVGIVDLIGMMWLVRRPCQPEILSNSDEINADATTQNA